MCLIYLSKAEVYSHAVAKKCGSGASFKQDNRALHKFADALYAYSQSSCDFPVSEALCPQRYTSTLFRSQLRKCVFDPPYSLFQKDLLFRTRCRIYAFPNDRVRFIAVALGPTSLGAVHVHREIMGNTEYPRTKVILPARVKTTTD
jgi:hypothetical protein